MELDWQNFINTPVTIEAYIFILWGFWFFVRMLAKFLRVIL